MELAPESNREAMLPAEAGEASGDEGVSRALAPAGETTCSRARRQRMSALGEVALGV